MEDGYLVPVEVENQPRNVAQMKDFGSRLGDFEDTDEPIMDLNGLEAERAGFLRQNDDSQVEPEDDNAIRCIPKVMQVSNLKENFNSCL